MMEKSPASDLATEIFKLQREINSMTERQDEMKKELFEMYKENPFDDVETLIGKVGIVVKGGATYRYSDKTASKRAQAVQDVLDGFSAEKKNLAEESKQITVLAKEPTKELAAIRKEFGTKVIPEGAEVSLRYVVNR